MVDQVPLYFATTLARILWNTILAQQMESQRIGFHKDDTNAFLKDNLQSLALSPETTIFVPLCGKTLDIAYLLSLGHKVVAAELNESAVIQLFENMKVTPDVSDVGIENNTKPKISPYLSVTSLNSLKG